MKAAAAHVHALNRSLKQHAVRAKHLQRVQQTAVDKVKAVLDAMQPREKERFGNTLLSVSKAMVKSAYDAEKEEIEKAVKTLKGQVHEACRMNARMKANSNE